MADVVDLCDDRSTGSNSCAREEEEKVPAALPDSSTNKSTKPQQSVICLLDDSSDEDDENQSPITGPSKSSPKKCGKIAPKSRLSSESSALDTPYISKKRERQNTTGVETWSSRRPTPSLPATARPKRPKTGIPLLDDSDSDDDDDMLFGKPSGLTFREPSASLLSSATRNGTGSVLKKPNTTFQTPMGPPPVGSSSSNGSHSKITPIVNPYGGRSSEERRRLREQQMSIPRTRNDPLPTPSPVKPMVFEYPVLSKKPKTYPDWRPYYAWCFWQCGRKMVHQAFQRPKMAALVKRIMQLAIAPDPIRSLEEYAYFGNTSVTQASYQREALKEEISAGDRQWTTPTTGPVRDRRFYTIAEACLGALLDHVQDSWKGREDYDGTRFVNASSEKVRLNWLKQPDAWVSLESLIPMIDARLRSGAPGKLTRPNEDDNGAAHYLKPDTRSMEFAQVARLEGTFDKKGPRIKKHSRRGKIHYELLPMGYETAIGVRDRLFPQPNGPYRCTKLASCTPTVDPKYKGIILGVDIREGGGGKNILHGICNKLDIMKVPYFVAPLSIGDYSFFTSAVRGQHLLCPIMVERKSVQDLAMSIYDGRWKTQKHRMYVGQYVFGYENCRMVYIIEGNEKQQAVSGGFVGARHFEVDQEKLKEEIDNLNEEGFDVLRTPSVENTMFELSRWAARAAQEIRDGTLKAEMSYRDFKDRVESVGNRTDFSRLAKYHRKEKLKREEAEAAKENGANYDVMVLDDEDDDGKLPYSQVTSNCKMVTQSPQANRPMKAKKKDSYDTMTQKQLQEACVAVGLPKSSKSKDDLIERLRGPHPPKLWLARKRKKQYVPERHNVAGTALLVGLYLEERNQEDLDNYAGMTKDELYVKAEGLNITKNPFSGGTTQTGPYHYDGWAAMSKLLVGDPALVCRKKGGRYMLTRNGGEFAGFPLAEALHSWCHEFGNCQCGEEVSADTCHMGLPQPPSIMCGASVLNT